MFGDLAILLSTIGVAPSTHVTCSAAWKFWVEWRQVASGGVEQERVFGYSDGGRGGPEGVHGVLFFFEREQDVHHRRQVGGCSILSSVGWGRIASEELFREVVGAGLARESTLQGGAMRVRRLVSWAMLKKGIGMARR